METTDRDRPPWGVLVTCLVLLGLGFVYAGWRLSEPTECAWLGPGGEAFAAQAVVPRVAPGCPLPPDSLVIAAERVGGTVRYTLAPDGRVVEAGLEVDRRTLGMRLWAAAGTLVFVAALFGLCGYAFSRRPGEPGASSALVFSSALLGSTLVTMLGLPPSAAFDGAARWLWAANVQFVYLVWSGSQLAWVLQFPTALSPRLDGARVRWLLTWAPALLWAALAGMLGAGRPFPDWMALSLTVQVTITLACLAVAISAVVVRLVRLRRTDGDPVRRQQLLWVGGTALAAMVLAVALWFLPFLVLGTTLLPEELIGVPGLLFVAGMAVAMLRFRLFDLDVVLVRTIVAAGLTLVAVALYLGTVAALGSFVAGERPDGVAVVGAVVVAIAVNPVRVWLTRLIGRAVFGDRDDPYRALSRIAKRLGARSVDWPGIAQDLRRALRVPYVAIERLDAPRVAAGAQPEEARLVREPLVHAGIELGAMAVATRELGERFGRGERRLITDLARQLALNVHEDGLTAQVQASRESLVLAREEERRQLRRALHDDLGPTLAGIALRSETVRLLSATVGEVPGSVGDVLDQIQREASRGADLARRLAYDLRPPALDDRGLAAALGDLARGLAPTRVDVSVEVGTDPLPAAVEVAAYRIVASALDNVARHAGASNCWVRVIREQSALLVEVRDDGSGLPAGNGAGVGLTAMRERATELGGSCTIETAPGGGTIVRATLPVGGGHG